MKGIASLCLAVLAAAGGCDAEKPSAKAVAVVAPNAAPIVDVPKLPWFAGKWSSDFVTEPQIIQMTKAEGAVVEWSKDDKITGVGQVRLELDVSSDGELIGKTEGVLGALGVRGRVSDEELRAELASTETDASKAFAGVLIAARSGDDLKGTLRVSTGDSLIVRRAELIVRKADGKPKAPPPAGSGPAR